MSKVLDATTNVQKTNKNTIDDIDGIDDVLAKFAKASISLLFPRKRRKIVALFAAAASIGAGLFVAGTTYSDRSKAMQKVLLHNQNNDSIEAVQTLSPKELISSFDQYTELQELHGNIIRPWSLSAERKLLGSNLLRQMSVYLKNVIEQPPYLPLNDPDKIVETTNQVIEIGAKLQELSQASYFPPEITKKADDLVAKSRLACGNGALKALELVGRPDQDLTRKVEELVKIDSQLFMPPPVQGAPFFKYKAIAKQPSVIDKLTASAKAAFGAEGGANPERTKDITHAVKGGYLRLADNALNILDKKIPKGLADAPKMFGEMAFTSFDRDGFSAVNRVTPEVVYMQKHLLSKLRFFGILGRALMLADRPLPDELGKQIKGLNDCAYTATMNSDVFSSITNNREGSVGGVTDVFRHANSVLGDLRAQADKGWPASAVTSPWLPSKSWACGWSGLENVKYGKPSSISLSQRDLWNMASGDGAFKFLLGRFDHLPSFKSLVEIAEGPLIPLGSTGLAPYVVAYIHLMK